jgi:DNA-binding NtrC family response regulator
MSESTARSAVGRSIQMSDAKGEVLILDERPDSLMDLFVLVSEGGYETTGVSSENEALSCVSRRKPDILIDHLRNSVEEEPRILQRTRILSPKTRFIVLADSASSPRDTLASPSPVRVEYVREPFQKSELLAALGRAAQAVPPP